MPKWGGRGGSARPFGNQPDHTWESYHLSLGMPKGGEAEGVQPDPSATSMITRESNMTYSPGCRTEGGREGVRKALAVLRIK